MPIYQPLVPTGTVKFPVDYKNLQGNFEQANIVYGTDHYPFDNAVTGEQGFHDKVTMPSRVNPTTIADQGIVYTKDNALQPGLIDLYYAYETDAGKPMTGQFFPLNACKAFGQALTVGDLVANSSFNVTSANFLAGSWTVVLSSAIVPAGQESRVLVLIGNQSNVNSNPSTYTVTSPTTITIRAGSGVTGVSFWVVAI